MSGASVPVVPRSGPVPQAGSRRTHPRSFLALGVRGLFNALLPGVALAFTLRDDGLSIAVFAVAVLCILGISLGFSYLGWLKTTYLVGVADIRVESGIVARAARSVPYERIQDVSLEQSLIPRLLGLVEIRFETGAGGKDELKLAYLSQAEGERLRELVRERREGMPATPDAAGAATGDALLFAMSPKRVATFGLFEFSLAVVAVIGGAAQQFEALIPFDLWDLEGWQERLAGPGAWLAGLGVGAQVVGAMIAIALLAVVGVVTGLTRTVLREWGFTLTRNAKGLRRRRGLLTRTDVVMPVHRVQALQIETGIVRHHFGWRSLKLVSLAQDSGSSSHVVAPFATAQEIAPIVATTGFALPRDSLDWHRASGRYAFHRGALRTGGLLLLAIVLEALVALAGPGSLLLHAAPAVLLALAALSALREWWDWRFRRYALTEQHLFYRHGRLSPGWDIADRVKLQSVEIAQGPLARRGDYATLHLGLAGGRMGLPGLPAAEARQLRRELLASMSRSDFSELV